MKRKKQLKALAQHLLFGKTHPAFTMGEWPKCAIGEGIRKKLLPGLKLNKMSFGGYMPYYKGKLGEEALWKYFGLDQVDSRHLFGVHFRTPVEEGCTIAHFLKESE